MTDQTDALSGLEPSTPRAAPATRPKPFYWSVRRELWENRSIYIAPAVVAGVVLFAFLVSAGRMSGRMSRLSGLDPQRQLHLAAVPFAVAAFAILATGFIVSLFYCLGALNGERRDRSILFWKSMPVSDLVAVLAKAFIPLVVIPIVTFAIVCVLQIVMLVVAAIALGPNAGLLWASWPVFRMSGLLLYAFLTLALWQAPIWGWLLLVSAWAKRVTFLWAVAPPFALCLFEKIAFDTSYCGQVMKNRFGGGLAAAFKGDVHGPDVFHQVQIDPVGFLTDPGLWGGLIVAAAFLAGAVWLRRNREPI